LAFEPGREFRNAGVARALTLKDLQEQYIARILEESGGDHEKAARILGVHPRTLHRRDQRVVRDGRGPTSPLVSPR